MSTSSIPQDFEALFDLTSNSLVDSLDVSLSGMYDTQQYKIPGFSAVNGGTVSPKDLLMDATTAPPSASFTDMSTPSFESSGYFSHDTSPLFTDADLGPGHEEWESLFPPEPLPLAKPEEPQPSAPVAPAASTTSGPSAAAPSASPKVSQAPSSTGSPRSGRSTTRPSSFGGVRSRHRDKPLPPIVYDVNDPVAVKRARNTEAARKSRARKLELQEAMERRIAELEKLLEESQQREQYWKSIAEAKP
ncbi:hypothetical protein VTO42DRAFT_1377 [Malbranchea cinnamomea]